MWANPVKKLPGTGAEPRPGDLVFLAEASCATPTSMEPGPLHPEEIYSALVDEELFEALPGRLAASLGGRSVVLHWHFQSGGADILCHSGYFTEQQLERYALDFATLDPWAQSTANRQCDGKAINLEAYVPPDEYERSEFYNEYIRGMGDDTFRCMGIRSDAHWGSGMIAVQRGKTQSSFTSEEVAALEACAPHLHNLLIVRGRLAEARRQACTFVAALDAMRDAAMVVSSHARLLHANAAAEALLTARHGLMLKHGSLRSVAPRYDQRLRRSIEAACGGDPQGTAVRIDRGAWPPLILTIVPVTQAAGVRAALLLASMALPAGDPLVGTLQRMFGLSRSEAEIAVRIADGLSPGEIADERNVSFNTVRVQLKSLFSKLGCTRQAEVIILVRSILPADPRFARC